MAHDAVGDEVARAGRNVEKGPRADWLDRDDAESRPAFQSPPGDVTFPLDRRIDPMEEPEVSFETTAQPNDVDRAIPVPSRVLDRAFEAEASHRTRGGLDDRFVRVVNPERSLAEASLRVEQAREESSIPFVRRVGSPLDELPDSLESASASRSNRGTPMLLTSAALVQGGIQDICKNWKPTPTKTCGHWEHRVGTDIDIDEQLGNDQDRLNEIADLGNQHAGFAECEPHPRPTEAEPEKKANHVHCRYRRYDN